MSFPGLFIVLGNLNIARTMAEAPQNTVMRGVLAALSYLQKTDEIMKAGRRREEAGMKVKRQSGNFLQFGKFRNTDAWFNCRDAESVGNAPGLCERKLRRYQKRPEIRNSCE